MDVLFSHKIERTLTLGKKADRKHGNSTKR